MWKKTNRREERQSSEDLIRVTEDKLLKKPKKLENQSKVTWFR